MAITIALAADWLAGHYKAPVMLFALLFGMTFHFLHEEGRCIPGIEFASKAVLRTGVALLGARITVEQIVALGPVPIAMVVAGVTTTVLMGLLLARLLRPEPQLRGAVRRLGGHLRRLGGAGHRLGPAEDQGERARRDPGGGRGHRASRPWP